VHKLSVIVTVFNAKPYLCESLDSLFGQSFQDFNTILVNDGSTDGSREIMIEYAKKDNVIMLENKHNEGIPVARNRALLESQSEYIAIHDADDVSLQHRLEKEVLFLDEHPDIDVVGGHALKINAAGEHIGYMSYPPESTSKAFVVISRFKLNPIIDPSCVYRRSSVLVRGGYSMDPSMRTVLDFHLWCRMLLSGQKLHNIQEPLIKYRINPDGVTRRETSNMLQATDIVWSAFVRRQGFSETQLNSDIFRQDCFTKLPKSKQEN
jgi:glycosyltransferase involved in cell wall biosynthesis